MAKYNIVFTPDLTKEKIIQLFSEGLKGKCKVNLNPSFFLVDFTLEKTSFTGIGVKYKIDEKNSRSTLFLNPFIPSIWARFFLGGLLAYIILSNGPWKKFLKEIEEFIFNCLEINLIKQ
ncbi:MAG TPA: hypothetical protein PLE45_12840 [Spirochaetota bacterium]|nr:hypothetical protein [Spirochaetota bacterium]HOL58165.1 hypothetical protein [Spirochaetota bacterium]HPP05644.1 hypothetical protein [Spirochaetota bacterium]